jgi:carbon-monoxide dehydrogenase medium subunit
VKPAPFRYLRPASVAEAVDMLAGHGGEARPLAGGQSLVPLMNLRLARPAALVDINPLDELDDVRVDAEHLVIGALVRHRRLAADPLVARHAPLLAEAARWIGHGAIRTRGTLGGSLAHADPAAELPCAAAALDAELVLTGPAGVRVLPAAGFADGAYSTRLAGAELITAVRVPLAAGARPWGFAELARRHGDFALVLAAVTAGGGGAATAVLGGAGGVALRVEGPAAGLAARCRDACDPAGDVHATAEWRRAMVEVLVTRAVAGALRC